MFKEISLMICVTSFSCHSKHSPPPSLAGLEMSLGIDCSWEMIENFLSTITFIQTVPAIRQPFWIFSRLLFHTLLSHPVEKFTSFIFFRRFDKLPVAVSKKKFRIALSLCLWNASSLFINEMSTMKTLFTTPRSTLKTLLDTLNQWQKSAKISYKALI